MFRSTSSVSSRSSLPLDIVNSEQLSFESDNSFNFEKWNIPKLSPKDIYTTSWLKSTWRFEYSVRTVEQTFAISGNNSTFQLFNKRFIENSKAKDCNGGSRPLAIIYRIYYRLMKTNLDPQAIIKNAGQSTLLIQSSTQDANIRTPKMIRWDEIILPNEWILENVSKPARVVNDTSNLDYIQQYLDGSVKISFSDLNISNQIQRPLLMDEKRNSFAGSTTTEGLHKRDKEIEDLIFPPPDRSNLKLKGISTNSQVSSAFYSTKTHPPTHKDGEGDSTSPTTLDFNGPLPLPHQCSVIHAVSKDFFLTN
jgi:hypothetical protein